MKVIDGVSFAIEKYVQDGFIVKEIQIKDNDYQEVYFERVKIYSQLDLIALHEKAGFEVDTIFGDYQLNAFSAKDSQRIILNSRKK